MSVTRNEGKKTVLQATIQDKTKQIARQMHTSHGFPAHTVRSFGADIIFFHTFVLYIFASLIYIFSIHMYVRMHCLCSASALHIYGQNKSSENKTT